MWNKLLTGISTVLLAVMAFMILVLLVNAVFGA